MKILSVDQSTSGTKALLFDEKGDLLHRRDLPHRQIVNSYGWVEHDPEEIYANVKETVRLLVDENNVDENEIAAIGISNQRETVLAWRKSDGKPLYNAIVWQCPRAKEICERIGEKPARDIKTISGMTLSPYFSGAKLAWLMDNCAAVKEAADQNDLCCGTIDAWLLFKLTDGEAFKTDYSNASRTQLFDIYNLRWSEEICKLFHIPINSLPEVCDSNAHFGETDFDGILKKKLPIHGVIGDSHGALFAQGCLLPGMTKATYGTGSSVMMNTGRKAFQSDTVVTSLAWGIDGSVDYVLEGNLNYTGAVTAWVVDQLKLLDSPKDAGKVAAEANVDDRTYLVPAFTGLGAPYWDSNAEAAIIGMSRTTGRAEIVKAAEECIGYQIADIVRVMSKDAPEIPLARLCTDGGPTKDEYLMQFQSDILGIEVAASGLEELSGAGAAYLAGIGLGVYNAKELAYERDRNSFHPQRGDSWRNDKYSGWQQAVKRVLSK